MKKLRLNLEELQVETFEAAEDKKPRGTVHAREWSIGPVDCATTSGPDALCMYVCPWYDPPA